MVYNEAQLNAVFSALADPTRRRILELLRTGESRVTDLAKPFHMSLPAVSKHLKVLESAGLLSRRREGRSHHLRARPEPVREARKWMEAYVRFWEDQFDALDRFLSEHPTSPPAPDTEAAPPKESP